RPFRFLAATVCVLAFLLVRLAPAENRRKEAVQRLVVGSELSDIRADGALGFRLKASIKLSFPTGRVEEGVYSETWTSKAQWRRELTIGDFQHLEVVSGQSRWLRDSPAPFPDWLSKFSPLTATALVHPRSFSRVVIRKVDD